MKSGLLIVALAVGLLAGLMTGVSPAGDTGIPGLQGLYSADPERGVGDPWQGRGPIETGALPDAMNTASMDRGVVSPDAEFPFAEIGGVKYRVGLDTGP